MKKKHLGEKIKLVHIIPTLNLGGAERVLVNLLKYGNRDVFDFSVITTVDGGPLEEEVRALGVPYFALTKSTEIGLGMLMDLTALLNRLEPDIVHTHLFGGHLWGQVASTLNRIPIMVQSEQNTDVDIGEVKHIIKQALSYQADAVVAASDSVRDFLIKREHYPEKKILVVKNAIEVERFLGIAAPQFKDVLKLLVIGRLEPQKGHDVLFEALSQAQFPWELTVVGEGSLAEDLVDRTTLLRIQDRIKFIGTTLDVEPLLAEHDVVVMPSRWEGIGLVIMEGLAAGRPVVASAVGGIREIIEHGKTGFLVPPEHPEELRGALQWVWEHPDAARAIGAAGREYAQKHFDVREMVKQYERLYAHLINK